VVAVPRASTLAITAAVTSSMTATSGTASLPRPRPNGMPEALRENEPAAKNTRAVRGPLFGWQIVLLERHVPVRVQQSEATLLWKRYPKGFPGGFGGLHVVHGHDNSPEGPLLYEGRTNLDTLAWRTGRLVIGVFDDDRPGGPVDFMVIRGSPAGC